MRWSAIGAASGWTNDPGESDGDRPLSGQSGGAEPAGGKPSPTLPLVVVDDASEIRPDLRCWRRPHTRVLRRLQRGYFSGAVNGVAGL